MYNIIQLNDKNLSELQVIAKELGIKKADSFKKEELVESKKMTPDMKYIKWPSNVTVMKELLSVVVASAVLAMLIAAGDQLGMVIVNLVLKFI